MYGQEQEPVTEEEVGDFVAQLEREGAAYLQSITEVEDGLDTDSIEPTSGAED